MKALVSTCFKKSFSVDGIGQMSNVSQEGYIPSNRYLEVYEYGDEDLGPNAPGNIP